MKKQLAFYFEQKHCTGCKTCQIACKDKNNLKAGQLYRRVEEISGGSFRQSGKAIIPEVYAFWISLSCNHCIDPACAKSCPVGAIQKRTEDGIVLIDQKSCISCYRCVKACPYNAIQYNDEDGKVEKCDFCIDELAAGRQPVCVSSCPMRALDFGDLVDLQQKYGPCCQTKGMPDANITKPALVISPHRDAASE